MKGKKNIVKIISVMLTMVMVIVMSGCEKKIEKTKFTWVERENLGTEVNVKELDPQLNGRYFYTEDTIYNFGFSAAGITFGFKGSSLEVDFNKCMIHIAVYVDDMEEIFFQATEEGYMKVVEGLNPNKIHTVTIARRSEGNSHSGLTQIKSLKISDGGKYYVKEYETPRKRIEVLGDSICCGYGNLYDPAHPVSIPQDMEDGTQTFATMLADYYDADLTCSCISGIGVGNKANSPYGLMGTYKYDNGVEHDFTKNIPDVVIIELGTNDHACGNNGDEFVEGVREYITFVRKNYPDATIIWYYGVMGDSLKPQIEFVVNELKEAGDDNLYALFTQADSSEKQGGDGHPSVETHKRMANELKKLINETVNW